MMEVTKVDLQGLEPGRSGWEQDGDAVTSSMVAHDFIMVARDALGPELRQALFGLGMPEIFALPPEAKHRNASTRHELWIARASRTPCTPPASASLWASSGRSREALPSGNQQTPLSHTP